MKVYLVAYSSLRNYFNPKPEIGEVLEIQVEKGVTIESVLSRYFPKLNEISIIMVDGNHQSMQHQLMVEGVKIAVFPASGGG